MRIVKLLLVTVGLALAGILMGVFTHHQIDPANALEESRIAEIVQSQQVATANPIAEARDQLNNDPASPSFGPSDAKVTLVEFFDYRCPYCKRMAEGIDALLAENPDLKVVFKEFPILAPDSLEASKAALAAHRQNKYLPFHRVMMKHSGAFTPEAIEAMAVEAKLDIDQLRKDMDDPEIIEQLRNNHRLAQKLKIEGTPAFILGDQLIPGAVPIEDLQEAIQRLAAQSGS